MDKIMCHVCCRPIPLNQFNRHFRQHYLLGVVSNSPQAGLGNGGRAPPAPLHSRGPAMEEHTPLRTESPQRSNDFQEWLKNVNRDPANFYTTIDGGKSGPDLQARHFLENARLLRETTKADVIKIVQEFKGLSDSHKETCIELVGLTPILPGLVAYIYTHLITCPPRGWVFKDDWSEHVATLKSDVKYWRWRGELDCVLSYSSVKFNLARILDAAKISPARHTCNSALLDGTMLMKHDIQNLAALVALSITGPNKDRILLAKGPKANDLVNLLHALLDVGVDLEEWCRRCLFDALILLSKATGHCPPGLYLDQGAISGLARQSQGAFGDVYKGNVGSRVVAVKDLKTNDGLSPHDSKKALCKEAIILRHLRHPNCLPLYGVYDICVTDYFGLPPALVSPWISNGTLLDYLQKTPNANRTILILDIVRGLHYLHSMRPHIAHRDLKPDNILVTKKGRACLADFGFVSAFDADPQFHTGPAQLMMCGTPNYMAPELYSAVTAEDKRKVNKRLSDMYALGCTIYATYTGRHPFEGVRTEMIQGKLAIHQRPQYPAGQISLDMWDFIQSLWVSQPYERLTAERALAWMEFKASKEGVDTSLPAFEEEWLWKGNQASSVDLFVASI